MNFSFSQDKNALISVKNSQLYFQILQLTLGQTIYIFVFLPYLVSLHTLRQL